MAPVWHVTCPVWGEPYSTIFRKAVVPSVLAAMEEADQRAVFHVYSDNHFPRSMFGEHRVLRRPIPAGENHYVSLSKCHWDVLRFASLGDRILLLNADTAVSCETVTFAEEMFSSGKKALVTLGIRALWQGAAPVGVSGKFLLNWCWLNLHPILKDCIWGEGATSHPTTLIFTDGANAQLHTFYPYPIAMMVDRTMRSRQTIDADLIFNYREDEYFVCTRGEIGVAELSGPERKVRSKNTLTVPLMVDTVKRCYQPRHTKLLRHDFRLAGARKVAEADRVISQILNGAGHF